MGSILVKTSLKIAFCGAEPWTNSMRAEIENAFHIDAIDAYGLSEVIGPGVASNASKKKRVPIFGRIIFIPRSSILSPAKFCGTANLGRSCLRPSLRRLCRSSGTELEILRVYCRDRYAPCVEWRKLLVGRMTCSSSAASMFFQHRLKSRYCDARASGHISSSNYAVTDAWTACTCERKHGRATPMKMREQRKVSYSCPTFETQSV